MEFELGLVVLGVVVVTATALYLVSVMGIKEKSFEEAIAEQKKRSEDLLGRKDTKKKVTVKDKSKKQKKAKEKEKHHVPLEAAADATEATQTHQHHHHHHDEKPHHVEIDPEPEILDDIPISNSRRSSFVKARETIKPILVNKDEHSPVVEVEEAPPANHFDVIHPKGDVELKKQISTEDTPPATPPPPLPQRKKKSKEVKEAERNGDVLHHHQQQQSEHEWGHYENVPNPAVHEEPVEITQVESLKARSASPDEAGQDVRQEKVVSRSKKSKKEQEREEITAGKLETALERIPLSSSEIQNLIDILLNKEHAGDSEWINKGKNDSVGQLKKQLMERERQLSEEQLTVQTLQNKLKEIRQEFTSEKSKFAQLRRQLEDASNQKIQDVQQLQVRLQQLRNEAIAEKQALQQKLQQMQMSLNTLREENVAVKSALSNVEQNNRGKAESLEREAEALRTQCGHLENQLKAAFQSNQDLSNQVRSLQEHLRALEEHKKQEEHNIHNSYASQIQEREAHLLAELKKAKDVLSEHEQEIISLRQQNVNLQNSLRTSQETAKVLEETKKNLDDTVKAEKNTKNLLEDSKNQVVLLQDQLEASTSHVQRLEEEQRILVERVNSLSEQKKAVEHENEKLNADIKNHVDQGRNSEDTVSKTEYLQLQTRLTEKESIAEELHHKASELAAELEKAAQDLQAQRDKNNELRAKNAKLMDTLSVTEKNLEARITQSELLVQDERKKSRDEALQEIKSNLLKNFPSLSSYLNDSDWVNKFATSIREEVETAKAAAQPPSAKDSNLSEQLKDLQEANARLQDEVLHYQNVLASTENLLSNLQGSIEKEERKWHQLLQEKESEINILKGQTPSVNTQAAELQVKLEGEREEKSVLLGRCSELENNVQNLKKQLEQVEALRSTLEKIEQDLAEERKKGAELGVENTRLQSVVINEQESSQAEKEKVAQLQAEISSLKKQLAADVASTLIANTTANWVTNGKAVDVSGEAEPVVRSGDVSSSATATTLASPHASTSSTASSNTTTPVPNATNADSPITSKESKPKKKKGASGRK